MGFYRVGLILSGLMVLGVPGVNAQALVSGAGVAIGVQDLESDLARVPPDVRASTFASPEAVQINVANLYVRRVLAAEAIRAKMDQDPDVKAALELVRDRVLSDALLAQIDLASQPSSEAIEAFALTAYKADPKRFEAPEQVKIRHILILGNEPAARTEAEQLLAELKAGADFETMAKTRSKDPNSTAKGADLGTSARGRLLKPFEDAAFKLNKPGELSGVVETSFGFHIIKLDEKRAAGIRAFSEVRDDLMKETKTKLINASRQKEKDRILASAKFDAVAIEAFAKEQSKK